MDKAKIIKESLSVSIELFGDIEKDEYGRAIAFKEPYDSVILRSGKVLKNGMFALIFNIKGSLDEENDIFSLGMDKLNIDLMIKRCNVNPDERYSLCIHTFEINLKEAREIIGSGFPRVLNSKRTLTLESLDFSQFDSPVGKYAIYTKVDIDDKSIIKGLCEFNIL